MQIQTIVVFDLTLGPDFLDLIKNLTAKAKHIIIEKMANPEAVINRVRHMPPDVILLPITQVGLTARYDFIHDIRDLSPHTQILALCENAITPDEILMLFGKGVMGYARLPLQINELMNVIHMVFKEEAMVDRHVAELLLQAMRPHAESFLGLLSYEINILEYLAGGNALDPSARNPLHRPTVAQSHLGNVVLKFAEIWNRQQVGVHSLSLNSETNVQDELAQGIIQSIEQELRAHQTRQNDP